MEKIAKLLFEFASVERLDILSAISSEALKHSEIAKKFDLTTPETSRHLERLTAAKVVTKNNNGEYTPSTYGRVLLSSLPFFRFLTENQEYLANHDLTKLPEGFLERLGEVTGATYVTGVYKIAETIVKNVKEAKKRVWWLGWTGHLGRDAIQEKASEDLDVKIIVQKGAWPPESLPPSAKFNFPIREMENITCFLAVYDDFARISFSGLDGKIDHSVRLVLQSPRAYRWVEELFLYYWNLAK